MSWPDFPFQVAGDAGSPALQSTPFASPNASHGKDIGAHGSSVEHGAYPHSQAQVASLRYLLPY